MSYGVRLSQNSLLDSGSYSDLTIITHGKERRVHQAIVCPQSEFIAKAGNFRSRNEENSSDRSRSSAIVDFKEEDSDVVGSTIHFSYRSNYDIETLGGDEHLAPETTQPHEGRLIMHVGAYVLTEKYVVEGLKALSWVKFETACDAQEFAQRDFFSAAEFAYASTVEADRGIRDAVAEPFINIPDTWTLIQGGQYYRPYMFCHTTFCSTSVQMHKRSLPPTGARWGRPRWHDSVLSGKGTSDRQEELYAEFDESGYCIQIE
jgi:hypothetical protein